MIKTESFQGKNFLSALQLIRVNFDTQILFSFCFLISNRHISFYILDIPEMLQDNHVTNAKKDIE